MLSIQWSALTGWGTPRIHPYRPLSLEPSSTVLHYAPTLFEGMKAYRNGTDRVSLFRPDMNMKRMNKSASRAALPTFNGGALVELIKKLVALDAHWIPKEPNHSLYIRPTLIGTTPFLGVAPSRDALLFVIMSPVGPYFKNGFKPVSLLATTKYVRAFPGGTGAYKLGSNYAGGLVPQAAAAKEGFDQILWLYNKDGEDYVTEVGAMNLLIVLKRKDGATELITPPLGDMILAGVTRDSIISLAQDHASGKLNIPGLPNDLIVTERQITMNEIADASNEGRLLEVFGAGTAAVVCPVERIGYKEKNITVPTGKDGLGPITKAMLGEITNRQAGIVPSEWSVEVPPFA
ncbi:branched-chain amino acid aminotransferase II [Cantharellus anzutake]|uniref:branched-chain amino acid aminotransferase II n=1 Tax=Cantharellus anzutake TaxID=1750568 RepID=UPI001902F02B|nr:branched-chain amino acid aminotransferase II [Cantharellus anzutake]KAF8320591.1 branched-chain amino acid aminotransferase II [Cantharellus anzutake]